MYVLTLYIFVWCIWSLLSCLGSLLYRLEQKRAGLHILDLGGIFVYILDLGGNFVCILDLGGNLHYTFTLIYIAIK